MTDDKVRKINLLIHKSKLYSSIIASNLLSSTKYEYTAHSLSDSLTTCTLKDYQLEGVNWLVNLYENGINGILADEMGLGKTIQSLAFISFLVAKNMSGPFLIVVPLSTINNWAFEIADKFPHLTFTKHIGSKQARSKSSFNTNVVLSTYELMIRDFSKFNKTNWTYMIVDEGHRLKNSNSMLFKFLNRLNCNNKLLITGTPLQNNLLELFNLLNFILPDIFYDLGLFENYFKIPDNVDDYLENLDTAIAGDEDIIDAKQSTPVENDGKTDEDITTDLTVALQKSLISNIHAILAPFILRRLKKDHLISLPPKREYIIYSELSPIQLDLYSSILKDFKGFRSYLIRYHFLKQFKDDENAKRFLLNRSNETFKGKKNIDYRELGDDEGFVVSDEEETGVKKSPSKKRSTPIPTKVATKKPRTIDDFFGKKENFIDLTNEDHTGLRRSSRRISQKISEVSSTSNGKNSNGKAAATPKNATKKSTKDSNSATASKKNDSSKTDSIELEDEASFLEDDTTLDSTSPGTFHYEEKYLELSKFFKQKGLQNLLMQLRQICNSSLHFDPSDSLPNLKDFYDNSAKFKILNQLVPKLLAKKHKILIFSQFTKSLDLISDFLQLKKIKTCRIDGTIGNDERQEEKELFDTDRSYGVFLISTRAGGLGINLVSADSVILFDSDWNPQVDLQAMDRVHRIGQTKPVIIYRLITKGTVEEVILSRADRKKNFTKLVLKQKLFSATDLLDSKGIKVLSELQELLQDRLESCHLDDDELEELLSRDKKRYEPDRNLAFSKIELFETVVNSFE